MSMGLAHDKRPKYLRARCKGKGGKLSAAADTVRRERSSLTRALNLLTNFLKRVNFVRCHGIHKFVERSIQMFRADPDSTRYVMKYRHCDGKLVLKVTDNRECLKYKTDQAQEAKKMEKLNNIFFTLMARGPEVDLSDLAGKDQMETQPAKRGIGRKQ